MATHWKVRPYLLTGGRTHVRHRLLVHTLVSVPYYDAAFAGGLLPEARGLYEQARVTRSVAELSASCGVSLGVTRVILGDLAASDRVRIHPETYDSPYDRNLLERVRDGLLRLA
ncbi:DUF742 domain-containing protein [Actinocatenispora rupis]|uniref:DUF742 domain-containing protein n=1 Tax=Actinocatenispora rupis TaxID=519421 RepID=A0A8J3JA73_9ACTN|nr:DUF742 domain-containing protein [Actinocatenispora rupis]GID12912.1 hypothetical protein Aru02nite_38010 [Actinocatenispora rupis]